MAKNEKKVMPTVLAFEKKIVPSAGLFYGVNWENRTEEAMPLILNEKTVRGTISNLKKFQEDPLKLDAAVKNPNPQIVDGCALDFNHDTLKVHFTVKFLSGVGIPSACNNDDFRSELVSQVEKYIADTGFAELSHRYATNLANGRFLWRNRVGAEKIEVCIAAPASDKRWAFNAKSFSLKDDFTFRNGDLDELSSYIADTFLGKNEFLFLEVDAYVLVGKGQEVYPSEEFVLNKPKDKNQKSKILYQVDDVAALHSQKIGNALRTIDTWYPEYEENTFGPIAIEPYGVVTTLGKVFREPGKPKLDFFSLFDKFVFGESLVSQEAVDYVMAVLVRGGVFGKSGKDK
ncbi:type I-F CRISPR-associated protein Csy3 [Parasphaerochaeta coccoides]|uniref:CRISPR-associated protein, Csy3 family n=1 Tax=Parasphaerochaeta coccoides (strain ATCC BAA-1237 / DSM 17374 / SPN1) TaxID=760011 RepID=F4GL27_PARC1|nr:type I-F CRISPR-associated protein Csy3 [Parasphaerochaeta coccoides]AEC02367.1 CRISPR-associated protein, Csy3 family [Parasphaerochaeta coccoides DSM 17374]